MHSQSTAHADPIFAVLKGKAVQVLGAKGEKRCRNCHYASWSATIEAKDEEPVGVTCSVCHSIAEGHPVATLPGGDMAALAREHEGNRDPQGLCLSCHAELKTGKGVPVCTTGAEARAAGDKQCVDCHMQMVAGSPSTSGKGDSHRVHRFAGGHDPAVVREAATLEMEREGGRVVVTVANRKTGHAVPTGNPLRFLLARVEQLDGAGTVVWSNIEGDAMPPLASGAVFMKVFSSKDGKKPVPPFMSVGHPQDSRLQPGEVRELRYPVAKGAAKVRATLEYHLAPRAILEKAKTCLLYTSDAADED